MEKKDNSRSSASEKKDLITVSKRFCPATSWRNCKTLENFLKAYNPSKQYALCANKEDCFFGDYPTLEEMKCYGDKAAKAWLYIQLFDLSEYCGCKEKLTEKQIEDCASIIATRYPFLKISEIMLYIVNMKAGQYGIFYGAVDPMMITMYLSNFMQERATAIDNRLLRIRAIEREEHAKRAISYEEYCKKMT